MSDTILSKKTRLPERSLGQGVPEGYKLLASVAVFSSLYDRDENVYKALSVFLAEVIDSCGLDSFTLTSITDILNTAYGFDLPQAVVKPALKLLPVKKDKSGAYVVTGSLESLLKDFSENYSHNKSVNDALRDGLYTYVENHLKRSLSVNEKEELEQDFFAFLLSSEELRGQFDTLIGAYVIQAGRDGERRKQLKAVQQGNLLYTGLRFDMPNGSLRRWNRPLYLFLETDVLFYATGIAGERYHNIFDEFYRYLKDMNFALRKKKMPEIRLCYFPEVIREVNDFFERAENIKRRKEIVDPSKIAMVNLLNGCREPSDVKRKRAAFDRRLAEYRITVYQEKDYSPLDGWEHNLESQELLDNHSKDLEDGYCYGRLQRISAINILRKSRNQCAFEQIGYVTVTCNSNIRRMEQYDEVKAKGIPRTISVDYIINRFWFALNRGFGERKKWPITIDIISKAQSLLAGQTQQSISAHYDRLKKQYQANEITEEELYDCLDSLRQDVRLPEYITEDTVEDSLSVAGRTYEQFMEQRDYERKKRREEAEESARIREENARIQEENNRIREQMEDQKLAFLQLQAEKEAALSREETTQNQLKSYEQSVREREEQQKQETDRLLRSEQEKQQRINERENRITELEQAEQKRIEKNKKLFRAVAAIATVLLISGASYYWLGNALVARMISISGGIIAVLGCIADAVGGLEVLRSVWKRLWGKDR